MDIIKEIHMSYMEYVLYLLNKYGASKYDYFMDNTCKVRNQNGVRTQDGLFQHHIDENKAILLSDPEFAIQQPFKYQKANRLVYCNFLEHFLLHIKIVEERKNKKSNVGIGGAELLWRTLNDLYTKHRANLSWQQKCYEQVKDYEQEYFIALGYLCLMVKHDKVLSKEFQDIDFTRGWNGNVIKSIYYGLKEIVPQFDRR